MRVHDDEAAETTDERAQARVATERWFLDRGVPHFIEDYSAREDILTRAVPMLVFVTVASTLFAFGDVWKGWRQAAVVIATFAALIGVWVLINLFRRRRPFAYPDSVNALEIAVAVVFPPLAALAGGHTAVAPILLASQLVLLAVIYFGASYGIVPVVVWAGGQIIAQVGDVVRVLTRALPLLLLFTTFLFINAEVWLVAANLDRWQVAGVIGLFAAVTVLFVVVWLREEVDRVDDEVDAATMRRLCAGTPMEEPDAAVAPEACRIQLVRLTRRQRANMLLVLVVSQVIQAVMVAVCVFGFFVAFGWLAIGPEAREAWVGRDDVGALYPVAGLLAAFSALYFAVYAVTDATYRQQFFTPIREQLDKAVAVRTAYRRLLRASTPR